MVRRNKGALRNEQETDCSWHAAPCIANTESVYLRFYSPVPNESVGSSSFINIYTHLIFWGEIVHHNTMVCGYYGSGWLDHASYPMISGGEGDFIHNLTVVGDGRFEGFLQK